MNCALIYFSGTGNTQFVVQAFKENLEKNNIEVSLFNIEKDHSIDKEYDMYIFGGPIYAGSIVHLIYDWSKKNIPNVNGKKALVFATQAASKYDCSGTLVKKLENKGFDVIIEDFITMPNNYYVVMFKESTAEEIKNIKKAALVNVSTLTNAFLNNEKNCLPIIYEIFFYLG